MNKNKKYILLEDIEYGNCFFTTIVPGKDHTKGTNGETVRKIIGYAETMEDAHTQLYGMKDNIMNASAQEKLNGEERLNQPFIRIYSTDIENRINDLTEFLSEELGIVFSDFESFTNDVWNATNTIERANDVTELRELVELQKEIGKSSYWQHGFDMIRGDYLHDFHNDCDDPPLSTVYERVVFKNRLYWYPI